MVRYIASFIRTGDPNAASGGLPRWEAWSNDAGAPRSLVLDVRGDEPAIGMSARELATAGVDAAMERELSPELYRAAASHMARSRGTVRSD
jgi:hypothetical protein